jgi:hypothetical protein
MVNSVTAATELSCAPRLLIRHDASQMAVWATDVPLPWLPRKECRIGNKNIMIDGLLRRQGGRLSGRGDVLMWRHSWLIQAASDNQGSEP